VLHIGLPLSFVRSAAHFGLHSELETIVLCMRTAMRAALCCSTPGVLAQVGVVVFPPSSLNRPHGPHLQARDNFTTYRLYVLPLPLRVSALAARQWFRAFIANLS
jgi:hypothetical protein